MNYKELIAEKKLTRAELKKREEIAKAIERDNPEIPMDKKMAIATATAKKVAEEVESVEEGYTGKGNHRPGWALRADPELAKKFKEKEEKAKLKAKTLGSSVKPVKEEAEQVDEQTAEAPSLMKHRIGVRVTDGATNKRKIKYVVVTHSSNKEGAAKVGEKHFRKKGDFVHGSFHSGMVSESELEEGFVVKYHDAKGVHKNTSKVFDAKEKAEAHAARGNKVDAVGGKYTVHKIDAKGHMKEEVEQIDEVKVGDSVHVGHKTKGGAGVRGVVTKVDGDSVHIRSHEKEKSALSGKEAHKEYKGSLKNVTVESVELEEAVPDYATAKKEADALSKRANKSDSITDHRKAESAHVTAQYAAKKEGNDKAVAKHRDIQLKHFKRHNELDNSNKISTAGTPLSSKGHMSGAVRHDLGNTTLRKEEVELEEAKKKKESCKTEIENAHEMNEDQSAEWAKIQQMDKGSVLNNDAASVAKRKAYLTAVYNFNKKYGKDIVKVKKQIERLNASRLGEETEMNEQMKNPFDWKGYIEQRKKEKGIASSSNTTKTGHEVKKTSTGTVYTKKANADGEYSSHDEKKAAGEEPVKRGRGRPAGSYGSYKARSAETNARAAAKSAASKAANRAKLKEAFDEEFVASLFEEFTDEQDYIDFENLLNCEEFDDLEEACKDKMKSYRKKVEEEVELEEDFSKMSTEKLKAHWNKHKDAPNPSPVFASQLRKVAQELTKRKAMKEDVEVVDEAALHTFNPETHTAVTKDGKDKIIHKTKLAAHKEQGWKERHSLKAFHKNMEKQTAKKLKEESEEVDQEVKPLDESINKYANFLARTKQ